MDLEEFRAHGKTAGRLAYTEFGPELAPETDPESTPDSGSATADDGGSTDVRTVLFLHGVATNGFLWRNVIDALRDERRCIAVDLPLHGRTPGVPGEDYRLSALAELIEDFCASLDLTGVDLVANDTGGAIAQIFAARRPSRLRTLTLTNCDTRPNIPPADFRATIDAAAAGLISKLALESDLVELARGSLAPSYEHVERLDDATLECFFRPALGTAETGGEFERLLVSAIRPDDLLDAEPLLARLTVPTLLAWGTGDPFFPLEDARWLCDLIPGATEIVEIEGGRLFFPDERADELVPHLRRHWDAH